ncbi:hypothetical protein JCM3770_000318 [Rhodotorula araucariae]
MHTTDSAKKLAERSFRDWVTLFGLPERLISDKDKLFTGRVLALTPLPSWRAAADVNRDWVAALSLAEREQRVQAARDDLTAAKVRQAAHANEKRLPELPIAVGNEVMVDLTGRRWRSKSRGRDVRAAKLFPRWDGLFKVAEAFPDKSTCRLSLPPGDKVHPTFHVSKLKLYRNTDPLLAPHCKALPPEPIDVEGEKEYEVEAIVDGKGRSARCQYLIEWFGYPSSDNTWETRWHIEDTIALDEWEAWYHTANSLSLTEITLQSRDLVAPSSECIDSSSR